MTVPATTARNRVALGVFVAVVLAFSAARYVEKIRKPSRDGTLTKSAILRWRDQVEGLLAGEDVYAKYNYPNPPIQGLILAPFTAGDRTAGALAWFALKAAMAVVALVWALQLVRANGPPLPDVAVFLTVVFSSHAVLGDLSHGNVNIFIAFLVLGALELYRRGAPMSAGVTLGLAIACKVTPALFVPYFVWKRAWRLVLGCVAGCVLWLAVVPGLALGWRHNAELLASWFDTMVRPFVVDGKVTSEHANQSIPGLTVRLLTGQPSSMVYDEDDGHAKPDEFHNFTDIGTAGAKWVVRGFQAAFVLGVVLLCRNPGRPGRVGVGFAAECSYVVLGMLLFSERTWKHHGVVLMLPFALLSAVTLDGSASRWLRRTCGGVLAVVFVLILGPSLAGGDAQDLALTYGSHTAVFLLLTGAVVAVLVALRRGGLGSIVSPTRERGP
jgi:alpha-1,2-mannosyltransferase